MTVSLTAIVADSLSGITEVTCNGAAGTVSNGQAQCNAPLNPARNSVLLIARDAAGNVASSGINVFRVSTMSGLALTPHTRTVLVGQTVGLALVDQDGLPVSQTATWASTDPWGNRFVTLGAGPVDGVCSGTMTSAPNRFTDVNFKHIHLEKIQYPPALEDALISLLLQKEAAYPDDLPYWCFPEGNDGYYNSNGFVHGLLNVADLPEPLFPIADWFPYRGWAKPVPDWKFGPP